MKKKAKPKKKVKKKVVKKSTKTVKTVFCPKCGSTKIDFMAGRAPINKCSKCGYTSAIFPEISKK